MAYTIDTAVVSAAGSYFSTRLGNSRWSALESTAKLAALQDAATDLGSLLPGGFPDEPDTPLLAALYEQALFLSSAEDADAPQILSESIDGAGSRSYARQSDESREFSCRALRLLAPYRHTTALSRG